VAVYHVYILANPTGVLYTGVTNYLERRVMQHREKHMPGFTKKYDVIRLVYFEPFSDIRDAINREKQIKGWRRDKKLALVHATNPTMRDLSCDFPK
jgi:putative endonuclease